MLKIGVVVHGPHIIDTGYALKIIKLLERYGKVKAVLGGTMGRTAVYDAHLENIIDISKKRLPSESIDMLAKECDFVFLLDYGKSKITGHAFGYKVFKKLKTNPKLIQIERPGEKDGTIIVWNKKAENFAKKIAKKLKLKLVKKEDVEKEIKGKIIYEKNGKKYRRVLGVSKGENIFVNGIVVGKAKSNEVTLVAKNGIIIDIIGGKLKKHGVEKLGKVDLEKAIIKTGLLRRSEVKARKVIKRKSKKEFNVGFLDHAAEDVYQLKNCDVVVTIGDDTTLVASDILYRFDVPVIGITDGDVDKVVKKGFKNPGSMIIEVEKGWDDKIGKIILSKIFKNKKYIKIKNINKLKRKIQEIINKMNIKYNIKEF